MERERQQNDRTRSRSQNTVPALFEAELGAELGVTVCVENCDASAPAADKVGDGAMRYLTFDGSIFGTLNSEGDVRDLTTWTVLQNDGPYHLGLRCSVFPQHQMA